MPYVSRKQEGWAHTLEGTKALGGAAKVAEWDAASKGKHFAGGGAVAKGYMGKEESFAQGGPVLGRTGDWKKTVPNRGFLDTPDRFTDGRKVQGAPKSQETVEDWGKGSSKANPKGADKSEKAIKPR